MGCRITDEKSGLSVVVPQDNGFFIWVAAKRQEAEQNMAALRARLREVHSQVRDECYSASELHAASGEERVSVTPLVANFAEMAAQYFYWDGVLRQFGVTPHVDWQGAWDMYFAEIIHPATEGGQED